jgi:hypothetical protein
MLLFCRSIFSFRVSKITLFKASAMRVNNS